MFFTVRKAKIYWTVSLFLVYSILGLIFAIPGPTLLDLQCKLQTTTEEISYIYTARSTGYALGSVLGGILHERYRQEPLIIGALVIAALSLVLAPWSPTVLLLCVCFGLAGFFSGSIDPGSHVFLVKLWRDKSAPYIQAIHFVFGVGALLAPLLAEPFLTPISHPGNHSEGNVTDFVCDSYNMATALGRNRFGIEMPYLIISCFCVCMFASNSVLFLMTRTLSLHSPAKANCALSDAKKERLERHTKMALIATSFVFIFTYCAYEVLLGQLLASFVVISQVRMTKSEASYLTSAFWASYTVGRIPAVALSSRFSAGTIISASSTLPIVGGILLVGWGERSRAALWAGTLITGLGVAPNFGSALAFLNELFPLTGGISAGFVVSAALGEMILPFLVGNFMERVPAVLLYVSLGVSLVGYLIVIIMHLLSRLYRRQSAPSGKEPERREEEERRTAKRLSLNCISLARSSLKLECQTKL